VAAGAHGEAVTALAIDPHGGSLAVGDARGLRFVSRAGDLRRLLHRGPVHDIAFLPAGFPAQGTLLAATEVGLYRIDADGHADLIAPAPGAGARVAHRIAVSPVAVAVATEAGAFLTVDARHWRRLSPQLPFGAATSVALRERAGGLECFAVVEGRLWRIRLARAGERWVAEQVVRETLPLTQEGGGPVDLVFGVGGAETVVVLPTALAASDAAGEPWRVLRPALPPGAHAQRLVAARGSLWLATDRGLLVAGELAGPWQRAAAPAGSADVRALASDAGSVYAAAGDRVLVARPAGPPAGAASTGLWRLRTPEGDPPIEHVQRAVLAYLELRPERIRALRQGVGRRGWLPIVSLRLMRAQDEDRGTDHDEAFLYGELRRTVDRDSSTARDFETALTFSWDLGDIAYHPEQIDVSREAREVIKLRDDVLDEVTQLYFERRRVLAELAARPDAPPAEKLRLRLRAAELAAGIDAWTGGWFGRVRAGAGP
jgi:ligand-binding sensor domain-containing protein